MGNDFSATKTETERITKRTTCNAMTITSTWMMMTGMEWKCTSTDTNRNKKVKEVMMLIIDLFSSSLLFSLFSCRDSNALLEKCILADNLF